MTPLTLYFKVLFMKEKYISDLREIKEIMNKSSKFISLSGLSGISAGIVAIIAAYLAYQTIYSGQDYFGYRQAVFSNGKAFQLLWISMGTIVGAVGLGIFFTTRKAKRANEKIWDSHTKRLLINLLIPLITGGILCLMLLFKGFIGILAPLTLIFYGLALVNASKYTLNEIRSLGILEIVLGLVAMQFIGYGLFFWTIGFGVLHIVYGLIMYLRKEKK